MSGARVQRRPNFLWQTILILLPVFVLALVGLLSLRQDRHLAEREAAQRARLIADTLVPEIWTTLTSTQQQAVASYCLFVVNQAGDLTFPSPYQLVPTPQPLDPDVLPVEQTQLWSRLENMERDGRTGLIEGYLRFLEGNPPDEFAA